MPTILQISLEGDHISNPYVHADGLEALLTNWIASSAPAHALISGHKAQPAKPYALSPIYSLNERVHCFYLSLLDDGDLLSLIYDRIGGNGSEITLGTDKFSLLGSPEVVMAATWEELAAARPRTSWDFEIVSPTATSAKGKCNKQITEPTAEGYFASWLSRLPDCAPPLDRSAVLQAAEIGIGISAFAGGTNVVDFNDKGKFIGFMGSVSFCVLEKFRRQAPPELLGWLAMLARFGPYCGTGKYTVRGMGQTRLLNK